MYTGRFIKRIIHEIIYKVKIVVLNATFENCFIYIVVVSFIWLREPGYMERTTDLPQITDIPYHIMLYRVHLAMSGIQTTHNINCIWSLHMYSHGELKHMHHLGVTTSRKISFLQFLSFMIRVIFTIYKYNQFAV